MHICTPHHQHVPVAIDCLDAGVAVLLEKPVAHTVAEADRLIAAARAHPASRSGSACRTGTTRRAGGQALLGTGELGAGAGGSATVLWHRDPAYYQARPWRGRWATAAAAS